MRLFSFSVFSDRSQNLQNSPRYLTFQTLMIFVYLTLRQKCQGQPKVFCINLEELERPVAHTKFQGNRSIASGEEDFLRFLPYTFIGMAAMPIM